MMIVVQELLWGFSIISIAIYCFRAFNKAILEVSDQILSVPIARESGILACIEKHAVGRSAERWSQINDDCNCVTDQVPSEMAKVGVSGTGKLMKLKKRPSRLIVPADCVPQNDLEVEENINARNYLEHKALIEVSGRDFFLACKKGARRDRLMEDSYSVMVDILGDPKQAFFAVIDGHGGRAAADFVVDNLGKNIVKRLENNEEQLEEAIHKAYSVTDQEFLSQGFSGGACVASVFLKEGELRAANVGDCRVVLSRNGVAEALTSDHRPSRDDERLRIENSGGFVYETRNGVWRVQGSLAVSRAIGDQHLKDWVISDPEITKLPLTCDCQFLILASDGLWDKVSEQEAVDLVIREESMQSCCKKLIEASSKRGGIDDITVMVVPLQRFCPNSGDDGVQPLCLEEEVGA